MATEVDFMLKSWQYRHYGLCYFVALVGFSFSCTAFGQGESEIPFVLTMNGPIPSAVNVPTSQANLPLSRVTLGKPQAVQSENLTPSTPANGNISSKKRTKQFNDESDPPQSPIRGELVAASITYDEHLPTPEAQTDSRLATEPPPWQELVLLPQISKQQSLLISLSTLMPSALQQSKKIEIARLQSFIELEKITQADANFDWNVFTKNIWTDTDEPTGSELDAGPGTVRRLEENLGFDAGARRTNRFGGKFEGSQNLTLNNTNSTFFDPRDRGISRLTMRYTQPLLRDRGRLVNEGQVILAHLQSDTSKAQYQSEINDVLEQVVKAYWELYRSRAGYCIRRTLINDTRALLEELDRRRRIDAQQALIAQVESQLNGQLADLDVELAKIQRAQNELVRRVGDRTLDVPVELVPQEVPYVEPFQFDLVTAFSTAIQNRGEVRATLKKIQSSQLNKDIAQNQLLPNLAMILETNASGINGNFAAFKSFGDQFSERAPTYSVGFTYEYPIGNRAAKSRMNQSGLTVAREMATLQDSIDQIRKEVRDSIASLEGNIGQAQKRKEAARLADVEVKALLERRLKFPEAFDQVSQLYIRTYIEALQRRASAEQSLASAHVDYAISVVQLRRAMGILSSVGSN